MPENQRTKLNYIMKENQLTPLVMRRLSPHLSILLIVIFSMTLYASTLKNGFVYDDEGTIFNNTLIKNLDNLPKLFDKKYFELSDELSYRPVVTFTYFLDYTLFGLNPLGYHLVNIILHAVNGIMLYIFLSILVEPSEVGNRRLASQPSSFSIEMLFADMPLITSLFFVAHPVLTESVNAVSFREDLLVFLFYAATMILYAVLKSNTLSLSSCSSSVIYLLSIIAYASALLSKEMAVTLPLIIFCYEWIYVDAARRRLISLHNVGFIVVTLLYLYIRFHYFYNPEESVLGWKLHERFLTIPWLILTYLKLIIFPLSLSASYAVSPVRSIWSPVFIVPFIVVSCLIYIASATKNVNKQITFGILFSMITLMPVYNIILVANPLADRYLYLPSAGFILILVAIIHLIYIARAYKSWAWGLYMLLPFLLILFIYSVGIVNRNKVWKDDYTLWSDALRKDPSNSFAHYNLGIAYVKRDRLAEAEQEFQSAIRLSPNTPSPHYNLGLVYDKQGKVKEAIWQYRYAVQLKPDDPKYRYNLAGLYYRKGQIDEAVSQYQIVLKLDPDFPEARNNLGIAYANQGHPDKAIQEFRNALELDQGDAMTHNNLGALYFGKGNMVEAILHYQAALRSRPDYLDARRNIGIAYYKSGRYEKAMQEFQTVLKLDRNHAEAHYYLGLTYLKEGLKNEAKREFELAKELSRTIPSPGPSKFEEK